MTAERFVSNAQAYYGNYANDFVRGMVGQYLTRYGEEELDGVWEAVLAAHSNVYGKPPDIAAIEKAVKIRGDVVSARNGNYTDDNGGVHRGGRRIGHMDGARFIPDMSVLPAAGLLEYVNNYKLYSSPAEYALLVESDRKDLVAADSTRSTT